MATVGRADTGQLNSLLCNKLHIILTTNIQNSCKQWTK